VLAAATTSLALLMLRGSHGGLRRFAASPPYDSAWIRRAQQAQRIVRVPGRLEIAPQLLRHTQSHHRRGLGTQYARAEACGLEGLGSRLPDLGIAQTALRTDQKGQCLRSGTSGQRLGNRMQDQLEIGFDQRQPFGQAQWCVDHRKQRTPALFAGADRYLTPVRQALVGALVLQANLATL